MSTLFQQTLNTTQQVPDSISKRRFSPLFTQEHRLPLHKAKLSFQQEYKDLNLSEATIDTSAYLLNDSKSIHNDVEPMGTVETLETNQTFNSESSEQDEDGEDQAPMVITEDLEIEEPATVHSNRSRSPGYLNLPMGNIKQIKPPMFQNQGSYLGDSQPHSYNRTFPSYPQNQFSQPQFSQPHFNYNQGSQQQFNQPQFSFNLNDFSNLANDSTQFQNFYNNQAPSMSKIERPSGPSPFQMSFPSHHCNPNPVNLPSLNRNVQQFAGLPPLPKMQNNMFSMSMASNAAFNRS